MSMTTTTAIEDELGEANELTTPHRDGSYSTHKREKEPLTIHFF